MNKYIEATKDNIDGTIGDGLVFVSFWAPWCESCQKMASIIKELAEDFDGKATVLKVNTDEMQETAVKYNIRSVPTTLILKDGKEVDRTIGAMSKDSYAEKLNTIIEGE